MQDMDHGALEQDILQEQTQEDERLQIDNHNQWQMQHEPFEMRPGEFRLAFEDPAVMRQLRTARETGGLINVSFNVVNERQTQNTNANNNQPTNALEEHRDDAEDN